jgi:hypothetical protein
VEASVAAVQAAIHGEMGSRLGWTGEELEKRLARLRELRQAYDDAPLAERATLRARHEAVRAEAAELQWHLVVQREAMGLTRHHDVYATYPLPPRLP